MDRKNMVRKSSFQMQRVLAASNKLQKRRSRPTLANVASIAPDRQGANKRHIGNPMRDPGSSIRSGNDLRTFFKKRNELLLYTYVRMCQFFKQFFVFSFAS
jgi:hypothetical protein